jgi:hypothetical protein
LSEARLPPEVLVIPKRLMVVLSACVVALLLWPSNASAQRRVPHARSTFVVVGGGFYRPYFYDPFFWGWYPGWYPGWYSMYPAYGGYPGYWYGRYASARIQVTPKQAEVYVDGYYAGIVDDFDGVFQRLDVPPGQHEIELYLDGYKTFHQKVLFRAGETLKLRAALQPLAPGETPEPRPVATPPPAGQGAYPPERSYPPQGSYPPPGPGRTRPMPGTGADVQPQSGFGTLAIRVQPADAVVIIDGERWDSPEGGSRLQIQLSAGPHRIEVRKDGFKTYSTSVTIRPGATETLNVSLSNGDGLSGAVAFHY